MLKRKILIKNKRLRPDVEKQQLEQWLREGKLGDDDQEIIETPERIPGEDLPLEGDLKHKTHFKKDHLYVCSRLLFLRSFSIIKRYYDKIYY